MSRFWDWRPWTKDFQGDIGRGLVGFCPVATYFVFAVERTAKAEVFSGFGYCFDFRLAYEFGKLGTRRELVFVVDVGELPKVGGPRQALRL